MTYNTAQASEYATFTEEFKMGNDTVTLIIEGFEYTDGHYFVRAGLWNETQQQWIVCGKKRYENAGVATEVYIKKYNLI